MAAVLGTLCIVFSVILMMIVGAVLGYFVWNCALWWMESQDNVGQGLGHTASAPPSSAELSLQPFSQDPLGWQQPAQQAHASELLGFDGMHGCDLSALHHRGGMSWSPERPCVQPSVVTIEESPTPRPGKGSPRVIVRSNASASSSQSGGSAGSAPAAAAQPAQFEDVQRGYASFLALKFAGNLSFHSENVAATSSAYQLKEADICYCFLCLEEVSNSGTESALNLGRWQTGQYAARVWVVALARFVTAAQKRAGAQQVERLQRLCEEWGYAEESFLKEVQQCEVPFQRKHGQALLSAFSQERIRFQEVQRAKRKLGEQGQAAAPQPSRLGGGQQALPPPKGGPAALPGASAPPALGAPEPAASAVPQRKALPLTLPSSRAEPNVRKRATGSVGSDAEVSPAVERRTKQQKRAR